MMRALITLTLATAVATASAAEVQVAPAVELAAEMVESRIVEGHPSARWLRSVAAGLRSGRISIHEASSLLAMISHQTALTASPVLRSPAPVQSAPAPVAPDPIAAPAEEDLAAELPPVEPERAPAPVAEPPPADEPVVAEPTPEPEPELELEPAEEAELADLAEDLDAIEAQAEDVEDIEVAEEGGAGGLMEVPTAADDPALEPASASEAEALDPEAAAELAALAEAADALAAVEQAPEAGEPEPDVEGALEALSRPKTPAGAEVFAGVETDDEPTAGEAVAEPATAVPAEEPVAAEPAADDQAVATTAPEAASAEPAGPPPLAEVVHVKLPLSADDPTLVMVEGVGVRKGQTLSVRRDGREAVRVLVLRVEGTLSMAMVLGASWQPDAQRPLVVGDQAWPVGG